MKELKEFSNYRVCDYCHTATTKGYVVDVCTYACSDACLSNLVSSKEKAELEEMDALYYTDYDSIDHYDDNLYTDYIYAAYVLRHIHLQPTIKHTLIVLLYSIFDKRDRIVRILEKVKNLFLSSSIVVDNLETPNLVEKYDKSASELLALRQFNSNLLVQIISTSYAKMPLHLQQEVLNILDPEGWFRLRIVEKVLSYSVSQLYRDLATEENLGYFEHTNGHKFIWYIENMVFSDLSSELLNPPYFLTHFSEINKSDANYQCYLNEKSAAISTTLINIKDIFCVFKETNIQEAIFYITQEYEFKD